MHKHLLAFQSPGRGDRIVTHDVSSPLSNGGHSFAPAGAEDLASAPSTPGGRWRWRPGPPTFVPAGLLNRWASADHDAER